MNIKRIIALTTLFFIFTQAGFALQKNKWYGGFQLGGGNESLTYNNSYNLIGSAYPTSVNYTTPFNYNANSYIFMGSVMMGYVKPVRNRFDVGYELSATGTAGRVSSTDQMHSPFTYTPAALQEYTAKTLFEVPFFVDLDVKPMFEFTKKLTAYLKAGLSAAKVNTSLNITHNNALTNEVYTATSGAKNTNVWGYVLGAGLEWSLSKRWSIFSEYNFHQFETISLKTVTITDNGSGALPGETVTNTINYQRQVSPFISSFTVGLHYFFR